MGHGSFRLLRHSTPFMGLYLLEHPNFKTMLALLPYRILLYCLCLLFFVPLQAQEAPADLLAPLYQAYQQQPSPEKVWQAIRMLEQDTANERSLPEPNDTPALRKWVSEDILAEGQTLVRYYLRPQAVYILACGPLGQRFIRYTLPARTLRAKVEELVARVSRPETAIADIRRPSTILYQILIDPIQDILTKKVLIIPDDVLTHLPFGLLLRPDNIPDAERKDTPYLLLQHEISYAYTGRLQADLRAMLHTPRQERILAYAATPLARTQEEVARISELLPTTTLPEKHLSTETYQADAETYRVLHLATHAYTDTANQERSFLLLRETETPTKLYRSQIDDFHLQADLVVLNGCTTGRGVGGLGHAFLQADAKSVVSTLWPVSDAAAAEVMVLFYQQLAVGQTKDQALRMAQVNYLRTHPGTRAHPYYWGSYQLVGCNQPIDLNATSSPIWWWGSAIVLSLLIFGRHQHKFT